MTPIAIYLSLSPLEQIVLGVPMALITHWLIERLAIGVQSAVRYMTRFE